MLNDPVHSDLIQMLRDCGPLLDGSKGIILVSAHWETSVPNITMSKNPGLYFDYEPMRAQLPKESFEFDFPTPGDAQLAQQVTECLNAAGMEYVTDEKRGWDQGVFVPMALITPNWNVPIVQMSVITGEDDTDTTVKNLVVAKAIRPLVEKGYTVVGSGSSSHDFRAIRQAVMSGKSIESESWEFEEALMMAVAIEDPEKREDKLMQWLQWPNRGAAHLDGHVEHFMPFLIAAMCIGTDSGERVGWCDLAGTPQSCYRWS